MGGTDLKNDNAVSEAVRLTVRRTFVTERGHKPMTGLSVIKYVKAPTGQTLTGGFMNLSAGFNEHAPEPLRNSETQVLVIPREDKPSDTPIRIVASTDKEMTVEKLRLMLEVLLNQPSSVKQFAIFGVIK